MLGKRLYQVKICCNPKNALQWFEGQSGTPFIEARGLNHAQEILDYWCIDNGTNSDPYFFEGGPCAIQPVAFKYEDPEEGARHLFDESLAQEIEGEDPSLILWLEEE